MEQDKHTQAWLELMNSLTKPLGAVTTATPIPPALDDDDLDLTVGGATKKPRKPRRRKEVTADKFIVLRVTEELYHKVQSASELAGTDTSKWVRRAVLEQLNK